MRNKLKAVVLLCTAAFTCAATLSSAIAGSTVPGWPSYIAMGGIGGPDVANSDGIHVSSLLCTTTAGTGNDDFQGAPVDVIFSYASYDGAGDPGIMVQPYKALTMTNDLTTLSNCANNKHATRAALVEYQAQFSGGTETTGLNDFTDSPNASSSGATYIMARHFISLGADAMALSLPQVAPCTQANQSASCTGQAIGGPVTYNAGNYYGTLILSPDLLGTVEQQSPPSSGGNWLADIDNVLSNSTNNAVNPGTGMAPGGVNTAVSIALCFLTNSRSYTNSNNPNGQAAGTMPYDTTYTGTPVKIFEMMLSDGYPPYALNYGTDPYWPYSVSNLSNGNPSQVATWFTACVSNPTYNTGTYQPPNFANTFDGWIQANNWIIRAVASKGTVTFGWQEDMYAAGGNGDFWMQKQLNSAEVASAYSTPVTTWLTNNAPDAISSGSGTLGVSYVPDYFVFDRYGEDDSGITPSPPAYSAGATLYNAQSWDNYLTGIGQISANFNNIPIMMWQIPGSHIPYNGEANPETTSSGNYVFSTAPVYFFGDSNLTSTLGNIVTGSPSTSNPPTAVGDFDMAGAGICSSSEYNCQSDSSPYYYKNWLTYYQGSANNYDWSQPHGKLALAAASNVFAILWGAGFPAASNVVANLDTSPDNDHGWLANKIINYYTNPTQIGSSQYALAVTFSGSGSGSVASSPSGISCTSSCSANFNSGTQVTLTATAASGSVFSGWSGACSGTSQCTVTVSAATNVTATFATQSSHNLSVSLSGSGTVTSSPSGISCGTACSASFASGAQVTLTAAPANGTDFSGWSGACSGTGSCVVTMSAAESVTATFAQGFALSVSLSGSGTVTSNPSGISCGSTCSASFASGTQVTLSETPASGYIFTGWSGACSGSSSCIVTMSAAKNVTATFTTESLTRTFVSSSGVDDNPCTLAAPCATFARAYTLTQQKGIIAALDPGKYGPLTITGPITINGNGFAAITGTAAGNGITINAGSGNVILTGLEVDGAGAAYNGIVFNSGESLTIDNCIVKDFVQGGSGGTGASGNGVWIAPTSGTINFVIVNTIALDNAYAGILYGQPSGSAAASGVIDHVVATNNPGRGIDVDMLGGSSGSAAVTISNSVANNNGRSGIVASGSSYIVTLDHDEISNNATGVNVGANTNVLLSRSVITKNSNSGVSNSGTAGSSTDNRIYGNGTNIQGNALTDVQPR
jgi:Divergent InlB B-repeat domain